MNWVEEISVSGMALPSTATPLHDSVSHVHTASLLKVASAFPEAIGDADQPG